VNAETRAAATAGYNKGVPAVGHAHSGGGKEVRALHQRGLIL